MGFSNFRVNDMAVVGCNGAPLVLYSENFTIYKKIIARRRWNILGGIGNVTVLPKKGDE